MLAAAPLYFGKPDQPLFGWMHRPEKTDAPSVALLICTSFGYEAVCSHRTVRRLGEEAAQLGVPALRFDYSGTGDSADLDLEADQLVVWQNNISEAARLLRQLTGATRICLLGIRLGATLALMAKSLCSPVDSLILIRPVTNGRSYLRELKTTQLAGAMNASDSARDGTPLDRSWIECGQYVSGYYLSPNTLTSLLKTNLDAGSLRTCSYLIVDDIVMPEIRGWVASELESSPTHASRGETLFLSGIRQMTSLEAQSNVVPEGLLDAVVRWLNKGRSQATSIFGSHSYSSMGEPTKGEPAKESSTKTRMHLQRLVEIPVVINSGVDLFGIVTQPSSLPKTREAIIFLNNGAVHHIGPSRLHVSWARRWAALGYVVLRFDLGGLGDSDTRLDCQDDEVFPSDALRDIRAMIEHITEAFDPCTITLCGFCSGAYHALRAAVAGLPAFRLVLVNPLNFYWQKDSSIHDIQLADILHNPKIVRQNLASLSSWRKLLDGQVNVWRTLRVVMRHASLRTSWLYRTIGRHIGMRVTTRLGRELQGLITGGTQVIFVFAENEPGIKLLMLEGGSDISALGDRYRVHIIKGGDHNFTRVTERLALENILSTELSRKE